jgi:hypothetical protein
MKQQAATIGVALLLLGGIALFLTRPAATETTSGRKGKVVRD